MDARARQRRIVGPAVAGAWLSFACVGCLAPETVPRPRPEGDERAYWVATLEDQQVVVFDAEASLTDEGGVLELEWASFARDASVPLGVQPPKTRPSTLVGRPTRVMALASEGFVDVDPAEAVAGKLRRNCAERLVRLPSPAVGDAFNASSIVAFGANEVLVALNKRVGRAGVDPCGGCVLSPGAIVRASPGAWQPIEHPALELDQRPEPFVCSDRRRGAWVLDTGGGLFHLRADGNLRKLRDIKLPGDQLLAPSAIDCWPSERDPEEPALFIRNWDYEVWYVEPPARDTSPPEAVARLTDVRRVRFGDLKYAENGEAIDRRIDVGVDTSIFEATGVDTLRAQFWTRRYWELRLSPAGPNAPEPVRSTTTAPELVLASTLGREWVVSRSARADIAGGGEVIAYEVHARQPLSNSTQVLWRPSREADYRLLPDLDIEARMVLAFDGLLLGTLQQNARLFAFDGETGTVALCSDLEIGTTPIAGGAARDGFVALGGISSPFVALQVAP